MDRITATAVNRMLVCQPQLQPRCGCDYRNRAYFFQQPHIFQEIFIQEKVQFTYFEVRIVIMLSQLTTFF